VGVIAPFNFPQILAIRSVAPALAISNAVVLTPDPRTAAVQVLVPEGLEVTDGSRKQMTLEGWKEERFKVPVTNRTALVGSRYPVFVSAEYDDGPVHQAVVAQGIVAVVGTESFFTRYRRMLWMVAGAVVLAWLAVVLVRALR